jgi:plasmid stabilization system protein ParE
MIEYTVVFTPEAEEQLAELYHYIAERTSAVTALHYTDAIVDYCAKLKTFPHRGTQRDDIHFGLRITNFRKNAVIAFAVDDVSAVVTIIGVFYGGRNYAAALHYPTKN